MKPIGELLDVPSNVPATNVLLGRFDDCLRNGFARLGETQRESLQAFVSAFHSAPLHAPLEAAADALHRSEFIVRHFLILAAARVSLQGAQYDALMEQLDQVLERERPTTESPGAISPGESSSALSSLQQWLMEVALSGFAHLEEDSVAPFFATLELLRDDPQLTNLSAMAIGFVNELLDHMPAERQAELPVFRWSDLWSGLMVRSQQLEASESRQEVEGELTIVGTDVRSHRNFVSVVVYGVLEREAGSQCVRIPFSGYKVDVLRGPEVWELFGKPAEPVLKALKSHKQLKVSDAELTCGGDLLLRSPPKLGKAGDPFSAFGECTALPKVPALHRHPIQIAELVCLSLEDDPKLPVDRLRLPEDSELTGAVLNEAEELIGLLRFDRGAWRIQPLAARSGTTKVVSGEGIFDARAKLKSKTLAILQERAGKLLRES